MKNYFFNPNTYSEHWTILTHSPEHALAILQAFLEDTNYYNVVRWRQATVDNLPDEYTIEEYGEAEVLQGERS